MDLPVFKGVAGAHAVFRDHNGHMIPVINVIERITGPYRVDLPIPFYGFQIGIPGPAHDVARYLSRIFLRGDTVGHVVAEGIEIHTAFPDDLQIAFLHKGEPLKSTTIAIRGENNRIIGLLCINTYLNSPLSDLLESFSPAASANLPGGITEFFGQDVDDMIRTALEEERTIVMNDASILPSNKNKIIVERLHERGIFQIKSAIETVSKLLGISKNTVYMYLRNIRTAGNK